MIRFKLGAEETLFDDSTLSVREAILIERVTGRVCQALSLAFLQEREAEATVLFYWLARIREYGGVTSSDALDKAGKFTDLDFDYGRLDVSVVIDRVVDHDAEVKPVPKSPAGSAAPTGAPPDDPS